MKWKQFKSIMQKSYSADLSKWKPLLSSLILLWYMFISKAQVYFQL